MAYANEEELLANIGPEEREMYLKKHKGFIPKATSTKPLSERLRGKNKAVNMVGHSKIPHRRTYSTLCQRWFDGKGEAERGEELWMLQLAGEIRNLKFQVPFILSEKPRVKLTLDFYYEKPMESAIPPAGYYQYQGVYEDYKGTWYTKKFKKPKAHIEGVFRVKMAWLKEKYGITVIIVQ
jgi:hypothetical protein